MQNVKFCKVIKINYLYPIKSNYLDKVVVLKRSDASILHTVIISFSFAATVLSTCSTNLLTIS